MAEDKILLTARYVEGDMDEAEIVAFEIRLAKDEALQQNLTAYHHIHQRSNIRSANHGDESQFKGSLKTIGNPYFVEKPQAISFKPYKKWFPALATILVIGLLLWAPWNKDLYNNYAQNGEMLVTQKGSEMQNNLAIAASFYNDKNYVQAEQLLAKEYQINQNNEMVGYYYGITLIENHEGDVARTVLTKIYTSESAYKYDAAYHIALSYLKEDKNNDCFIWLQKIPAGTSYYMQAIALMQKL